MKKDRRKKTLSLAEYRKRKRNRKSVVGLAAAFSCMAICASRMATTIRGMGSAVLKLGSLYNSNPEDLPSLNEVIVNTKSFIDRMRNTINAEKVDISMKDILAEKMSLKK